MPAYQIFTKRSNLKSDRLSLVDIIFAAMLMTVLCGAVIQKKQNVSVASMPLSHAVSET